MWHRQLWTTSTERTTKSFLDLMNAMFDERTKVLKKMLFEMMTQKQGEYELIRAEFEP